MSGPKVVRIVTREEVIAICEGHLRQLEQAITQWIAQGTNCGEVTEQEIEATRARQRQLAELLKQDAFVELQKKVPDEMAYLKADALCREQLAIEKAAIARKRARQGRENAVTLISALEARGIQVPIELSSGLESVADGNDDRNADAVLARGFALLAPPDSPGLTDAQRSLAAKLAGDEESQTFEAWKASHIASSPLDALLERVDSQIAEAQVLLGESHTATYLARLRTAEAETNDARRKLLLDSLVLNLSNGISQAKAQRAASDRLTNLATELQQSQSDEAASLRSQVAACNGATAVEVITALAETCRSFLDREAQRKAAQSRRDVILQGLARLGYEVNEGMSTAWANDGRVVVRKPSLPGYGVEVGGQAESSRLQVRAVALTNERDTNRDKDVETIWCGEFSRLQQLVAEHGDNLLIERAMAVGQVPLKVVHHGLEQPLTTAFDRRTLK
jgi:hypothetical protein